MKYSLFALASLAMMGSCHAGHDCENAVDIACGLDGFSTLCAAIKIAGLEDALSMGHWTIFAPTDTAFEELGGEMLAKVLGDTAFLTDILTFHAVTDAVSSDELYCTMLTEMANGQDSRTVCVGHDIHQKGGSNPRNDMPRIIQTDIETCQGYIHVVDEVMLPGRLMATPPAKGDCHTIAEIACGNDDFSTLCSVLNQAGLVDELSHGHWTVFAPTDTAFAELDSDLLDAVLADEDLLKSVLLFHVVDKVIYAEDLECTHLTEMANGNDSRHVCLGNGDVHQKGAGNPRDDMPRIIDTDIGACNGVVHVVDEVMLPPL